MLDLAKIEARKFDVEINRVSPLEIVGELVALMNLRATEKNLKLLTRYDPAIPATIDTDPKRLKQILLNLVGNAIKFTDQGEVEISVSVQTGEAGREILFAIRDTGIGMSPEDLGLAFEPFSQAKASSANRPGGTGLGLAISKNLAELLGGRIDATSGVASGSTFRLMIPLRDFSPVDSQTTFSSASAARVAQVGSPLPTQATNIPLDCRVLIADDRFDHRTVIAEFLSASGAIVSVTDNGRSAVDSVMASEQQGNGFGVVLMDMHMPELDGYEATAMIRSAGFHVPIIALTASAMKGDLQRCLAIGCNDYLTKPIDFTARNRARRPSCPPVQANLMKRRPWAACDRPSS